MDSAITDRLLASVEHERTRKGPPPGFPALPDIPGGRYTDQAFQCLEREHLWKKSWVYAGHKDEFPSPGSYKLWQRTGSPILIVRDKQDQINAFYNSCRHRGGPIVRDESGSVRNTFTCGYHGWTYDLTGKLVGVPDRDDFIGLDVSCRSLIPLRCECLGNWIFVSEDAEAVPLAEYLGPTFEYFQGFPLDSIRLVQQETFEVSCNFKILQETFFEVSKSIRRFRGEGSLWAWIRTIASSKALMRLRRNKYRDTDELHDESIAYRQEDGHLRMDLEAALERLPEVTRAVVWLHDVEGYTHNEIAEQMGKSVSFSKSQLSRAHVRLRRWLGGEAA